VTHHDAGPGPDLIGTELLVVALLAAAVAYVVAARRTPWPAARVARWSEGIAVAVVGLVVSAGPHDLRVHVVGHLLLGMVAPLLLATAAPVTLALRALPRPRARALGRLLRSRPFAVVSHPAVAALLDTGGMWLLFRTDLLAAVPPVLVHAHVLAAGYLFAFSLVGGDPAPHRPALGTRAAVLVAAVAAHDVLAKLVYSAPAAHAEAAGLLLHYGGTPVHVVLFLLLGREWAAGQRRTRRRAARRRVAARSSGTSPP
jgi:putative membrane protein